MGDEPERSNTAGAILDLAVRTFETPGAGRVASFGQFLLGVGVSITAAYALMSSEGEVLLAPLALVLVIGIALALPPTAFLVAVFVGFATLDVTFEYAVSVGPATAYGSDLIVGMVLLRGLLPRDRLARERTLGAFTTAATTVWIVLMLQAAVRGVDAGTSVEAVMRAGMAAIYWPLLFFGFSRTFSERDFDIDRFFNMLCGVGVALVGYMLMMRALGRNFEAPDAVGRLGEVVTTSGAQRRDYGFHSAFIFYPAVALLSLGRLIYERERALTWIAVAGLCVAATLLTLIRAEIFGLAAGVVAVLALSGRFRRGSRVIQPRRSAVLGLAAFLVVVSAIVIVVDPKLGSAVSERTIGPFTAQSTEAEATLDVRLKALDVGVHSAKENLFGVGLRSPQELRDGGINPTYLAHSGYTTMLVYVGWPGLVAGLLAIVGLLIDSARRPTARPWLHPVLVGVLVLLLSYSFGASGIVGQEQVMALGALFVAARFASVSTNSDERSPHSRP